MKFFINVTGLSENQFADETGISQSFINQVNNGVKFAGERTKNLLADYFMISFQAVERLLQVENEKEFLIKLIVFQLSSQSVKKVRALSNLLRFM